MMCTVLWSTYEQKGEMELNPEIDTMFEIGQDDVCDTEQNEEQALEVQVAEVPYIGEVLVGGDPFGVAGILDDNQGDNILNAQGNCGIVSVVNIAKLSGINLTENEALVRAVQMHLCSFSTSFNDCENGGTNAYLRQQLLSTYGISSFILPGNALDIDQIAQLTEKGHVVNLSVNAGYLWGDVNNIDDGSANHSVVVTGTARDPTSGCVVGLYICDSGQSGNSAAVFVPTKTLHLAYTASPNSTALVTNAPVRA